MKRPTLHLICNAHLDPVWQWRWEEGCGEALSTFGTAVEILRENTDLVFNHNEAVLYQWVQRYDPALFKAIRKLVQAGRWCISGGWFVQPDVNLPGTESIIRQIAEGRAFFAREFGAVPVVAYNFDSFGHSGGLPQILRKAGYRMYIHMRPQQPELNLPSDLYRWRGVEGSEILTYRIAVGLYHTERDNLLKRLQEGTELALRLNRDVPVFWGIGDHGGGATREDLERIREFMSLERRVRIVHSTTERFFGAVKSLASSAPVVEGDLQRVFTGCYTSVSRLKRRAQRSLGELVQAEALASEAWWRHRVPFPAGEFAEAWRDHLFNDFHDILPGSCTELAEQDALDQYGRVSETLRRIRLDAVAGGAKTPARRLYIPVTVINTNPGLTTVPVDVECMLDLRPKWTGTLHLRLFTLDGIEIPCQEEQPESLLPFNGWRRKVSFLARLPQFGSSQYELRIQEGTREAVSAVPMLTHRFDSSSGLVRSLASPGGRELLAGELMKPLIMEDDGDAWGADRWSYRKSAGVFLPDSKRLSVVADGAARKITETVFVHGGSRVILQTAAYPTLPFLEYRLRVQWNETRKRLKLAIPSVLKPASVLCEVPGGAIRRPGDGQEHVHGRWCMLEGRIDGEDVALGIVNSGQHGFDFSDGELRLSVLRSAAYCHEQGFALGETPSRKYMDQGIHDLRLLVVVGHPDTLRRSLTAYADWLSAPPLVYSHLPVSARTAEGEFLKLNPDSIRLLALKPAADRKALILRLQETAGEDVHAGLELPGIKRRVAVKFKPFEIKTFRVEKGGRVREVALIDER